MTNQTMHFQTRNKHQQLSQGGRRQIGQQHSYLVCPGAIQVNPNQKTGIRPSQNIDILAPFYYYDHFSINHRKMSTFLASARWVMFNQWPPTFSRIINRQNWGLLIAPITIAVLFIVAIILKQTDDEHIILGATISITISVPDSNDATEGNYIASDGLATLVTDGDETFIATHDHWSLFAHNRGFVQFSNAAGKLLLDMDLDAFRRLIIHRDGGTTILDVPDGLKSIKPARLAKVVDNQNLKTGDTLLLVHRDKGQLTIVEAGLMKAGSRLGQATIRMENLNGEFIGGGDSGGGVWVNDRLVGNMWATIMMEDNSTGAQRPTAFSIAALYPEPTTRLAFISN